MIDLHFNLSYNFNVNSRKIQLNGRGTFLRANSLQHEGGTFLRANSLQHEA